MYRGIWVRDSEKPTRYSSWVQGHESTHRSLPKRLRQWEYNCWGKWTGNSFACMRPTTPAYHQKQPPILHHQLTTINWPNTLTINILDKPIHIPVKIIPILIPLQFIHLINKIKQLDNEIILLLLYRRNVHSTWNIKITCVCWCTRYCSYWAYYCLPFNPYC